MPRHKKGTNDHDSDGRKGGSKSAPSPVPTDVDELRLFELGRTAWRNGIRREDSPFLDPEAKTWRKGWDFQSEA